jgi:hypothetical protein
MQQIVWAAAHNGYSLLADSKDSAAKAAACNGL